MTVRDETKSPNAILHPFVLVYRPHYILYAKSQIEACEIQVVLEPASFH